MDIFTSMSEFPPRTFPAHDLIGDLWLNTDPLALHGLRGHVILLFFWDFACGTSLSLLPTVQEWYRRYGPYGLVALGVHSPKFPFSGDPARVRKEALRIGVSLPVVVDRSQLVWSRYDCRTWPTILLIDADGYLRSRHEGYQESQSVEQAVRYLLHDAGSSEGLPDPSPSFDRAGEGNAAGGGGPAGEVFAGYRRGSIGNIEGVVPESTQVYTDPGIYLPGRIYLEGPWQCLPDAVRSAGAASAVIPYAGHEAHLVAGCEGPEPMELVVSEDGHSLAEDRSGSEVRLRSSGESVLAVQEPRLYRVALHQTAGSHRLRIACPSAGFDLYAVSFIAAILPDVISRN
jgi:thiol-disulfide isomerase/thioredoxin